MDQVFGSGIEKELILFTANYAGAGDSAHDDRLEQQKVADLGNAGIGSGRQPARLSRHSSDYQRATKRMAIAIGVGWTGVGRCVGERPFFQQATFTEAGLVLAPAHCAWLIRLAAADVAISGCAAVGQPDFNDACWDWGRRVAEYSGAFLGRGNWPV